MLYLKKIKKIIVDYWEIFVGFLVLLIGIVIGTSGSRNKVLTGDVKAKEKARIKERKATAKVINKNQDAIKTAEEEKKDSEVEADKVRVDREKELLKDPDKLDNILKEKFNLKGE